MFDNDGTLWCEKPMPIQLDFIMRRLAEQAETDPALRTRQLYQAAYTNDSSWLGAAITKHYQGDQSDLKTLAGAVVTAFDAVPVAEYDQRVRDFFATGKHPSLGRPHLSCGYVPMIDVLRFFEANGITNYIASGGDRDFMRPIATTMYGIPPQHVIGSSLGLTYDTGSNQLLYKSSMEFFDDGPEKPVRIWSRAGRRPIVAVGNSNGDVPMLGFSGAGHTPALRLLVLHDDPNREFEYTDGAEDALSRAASADWTVISVRNDWKNVFVEPS